MTLHISEDLLDYPKNKDVLQNFDTIITFNTDAALLVNIQYVLKLSQWSQ